MNTTGRYITDAREIVFWSFDESCDLKASGATRVHLFADGDKDSLSRGYRDEIADTLRGSISIGGVVDASNKIPRQVYEPAKGNSLDLADATEDDLRAFLTTQPGYAPTDAIIAISERRLMEYVKGTTGILLSPAISSLAGTEPGFELHDAAAVERWEFPPMEFLVDQLIPQRGLTWIGGLPKLGKSLLALYLGLAVACDRERAADQFEIRDTLNVLYICREDPGGRLQARIQDITAPWGVRPAPGRFLAVVRPHFDINRPEHLAWLQAVCLERGIGLVILDTWTALSPNADPIGAKDQTALAAAVANFTQAFGGAVVVLDHSRKNPPEGAILSSADILGPSQKWQAAEHVIMLGQKANDRIPIFVQGKDADTARFLLAVSSPGEDEVEKFTFAGDVDDMAQASKEAKASRQEQAWKLVEEAGYPTGAATISDKLKVSKDTATRYLRAGEKAGRLRVVPGKSVQGRAMDSWAPVEKEF
jgi:hypothetical protein